MLEKMFEMVKKNVVEEMEKKGFIFDGDNTDRFIDEEIRKEIEKNCEDYEKGIDLYFDELENKIQNFMRENYKKVGKCNEQGIYVGYFYKYDCHFETVEDLENFFGIGE